MSSVGYGPLLRVDGPPPIPPVHGLLAAAEAPAAGVRIVPEGDDRWMNGVEVFPYPTSGGGVWDTCALGSDQASGSKNFGQEDGPNGLRPDFGSFTIYLAETCTSYKVWDQKAYAARASVTLEAVQSALVAKQLMFGDAIALNPHLSDGSATTQFPNLDATTDPRIALQLLEEVISNSDRLGVIHCTAMMATSLLGTGFALSDKSGVIRTINGVVVIPDFGYTRRGAGPAGHVAASGAMQEWAYATGPIDIRRSEMWMLPNNVEEALERGTGGASTGRPNAITYRAERQVLVDWDTAVQAAVLVDRCKSGC